MDWYYADGDNRVGPIDDEQFRALVNEGTITDETLVWHGGIAEWVSYASLANQSVASESYAHYEPIPHTEISGVVYGGFWIRFVAKVLDNLITGVAGFVVQFPLMLIIGILGSSNDGFALLISLLSGLVSLVVPAAYSTWFIGRFGATPGKMALGLKVVRSDGGTVSYGRAFARYISEFLSALILLIGYIIAAFDVEKRTLHDHICDTRVIVSRR